MAYNLLINGVSWGYNPLILTFNPNLLGHPSGVSGEGLKAAGSSGHGYGGGRSIPIRIIPNKFHLSYQILQLKKSKHIFSSTKTSWILLGHDALEKKFQKWHSPK